MEPRHVKLRIAADLPVESRNRKANLSGPGHAAESITGPIDGIHDGAEGCTGAQRCVGHRSTSFHGPVPGPPLRDLLAFPMGTHAQPSSFAASRVTPTWALDTVKRAVQSRLPSQERTQIVRADTRAVYHGLGHQNTGSTPLSESSG